MSVEPKPFDEAAWLNACALFDAAPPSPAVPAPQSFDSPNPKRKPDMEKQVNLEFGVDIDDADPLVVRVWDGEKSYPCHFSTEADAKMADALTTKMMEIVCALWESGAELLEAKTWPSGARPAGEPPCPHLESEAADA